MSIRCTDSSKNAIVSHNVTGSPGVSFAEAPAGAVLGSIDTALPS